MDALRRKKREDALIAEASQLHVRLLNYIDVVTHDEGIKGYCQALASQLETFTQQIMDTTAEGSTLGG